MIHATMNANMIDHENGLIYAQTIQSGLLPKKRHFDKFFSDHFVMYKPQHKIGGDFYWLTKKNNMVYFAMADCTGHGVSGAMLSVLGISLLNYVIQKDFETTAEYLMELDKKWIETFNNEFHDMHFNNDWLEITLIAYNTTDHTLSYSSASGEFAICQDGVVSILKGNNHPIGGWQIEANRTFNTYHVPLTSDTKLYFFSDGMKHQFNAENTKKFSKKRLLNILNQINGWKMNDQRDMIDTFFDTWKEGTNQTDDVSLIGIDLSEF